jgi:hypothetical protein
VIEREMEWREEQGLPVGFEGLKRTKPIGTLIHAAEEIN